MTSSNSMDRPSDATGFTYVAPSVIAVRYNEGVLLGADCMVTLYWSSRRFPLTERFAMVNDYTLLAGAGEHADTQFLAKLLKKKEAEKSIELYKSETSPQEFHSFVRQYLYSRRSEFKPLLGSVIIAGYDKKKSEGYLGGSDMYGTPIGEKDYQICGIGAQYLAIPHLRREARADMSLEEAKTLIKKCFAVISQSANCASDYIQFAQVTKEGYAVSDPELVEAKYNLKLTQIASMTQDLTAYSY